MTSEQALTNNADLPIAVGNHAAMNSTRSSVRRRTVPLVELSLENITYAPVTRSSSKSSKSDRREILSNVSTKITPFELTAWMGPSGCGKTSLISVAAGLVADPAKDLIKSSCIRINGDKGSLPKNLVGVVWQEDLLLSNLSVRETVRFAAKLKAPPDYLDVDVDALVEITLAELNLTPIQNSLIGIPGGIGKQRGISGGERKRVAVAVELVARPSVLLLDEPTSGLDSSAAYELMVILKSLTQLGHAVAVVIHQPRTSIFEMIDNLLLLEKGRVVYEGKASGVKSYLESCPGVRALPPETGKADWIMDVINEDEKKESPGGLLLLWETTSGRMHENLETTDCSASIRQQLSTRLSSCNDCDTRLCSVDELKKLKNRPNILSQLRLLIVRASRQQRGDRFTRVGFLLIVIQITFVGLAWGHLPNTTRYIHNRASLFFYMIIVPTTQIVGSSLVAFSSERRLLSRERAKKMYGVLPYFIAKTLSDMVNGVLLHVVFGVTVYWICNLRATAGAFFTFFLTFYLTVSTAQSMGFFISVAIPSFHVALQLTQPLTTFLVVMGGGFYIPFDSIPPTLAWASWLSLARYAFSAFLINEFSGRDIECDDSSLDGYNQEMMKATVCPLQGSAVLSFYGIHGIWASVWLNIGALAAVQVCLRVATYYILRYRK